MNDIAKKIIDLEFTIAHLEHELQQMNSVLLAVQAELKSSKEQIGRLERRMLSMTESSEERSPLDERPPHY